MPAKNPSEETLIKMLEIQWQDHFQTRAQTWKALEITAVLAVALVGFDWQFDNRIATIGMAILLLLAAQSGVLITLRHRIVEITKFRKIAELERELGMADKDLPPPAPLAWWSIFQVRRSNTPLFILRMFFAIQVFAIGYGIARLLVR